MRHDRAMRLAAVCLVTLVACSEDGEVACTLDDAGDAGDVTASAAQRCNVSGSMGQRKWWRISAELPGTDDIVQLELYEQAGAFAGGTVRTGTFAVEADPASCGVCLRGRSGSTEYRGVTGTVTIDAIGAGGTTANVTITGASFEDTEGGACVATVERVRITGEIQDLGGTGMGGGGGGTMQCPKTVGD